MVKRVGNGFWLVAIITIVIVFLNLGGVPLLDPDEPVYAETPKEMFIFNEFLSPRIYGEYWYDKPPMYYWLVAASYKIFGINEFSARFPSAVLAVACTLLVYQSGRRLFSERAGVAGALVLATSIEFFYLGKAAVTDITLLFFLSASLLAFIDKKYYIAYLFAGFATLTKGPIGLLFPGGIIFFYLLVTRNWALLKSMKIFSGLLIYAAIAAPWYILMYNIHGSIFVDTFLGFHNITRFTSPEHPEGVLWYYYIPVLILGFFPWTGVMIQSIWNSLTKSTFHFSTLLFLNIWALFIFVFFTISQTKLVSYILPMYPPLSMIVGWYIDRLWTSHGKFVFTSWTIGLSIVTILLIGLMIIGVKAVPILANGIYISAIIFVLMSSLVGFFLWKKDISRAFWTKIISMALFSIVLTAILFPIAAPMLTTKNIAQEFNQQYDGKSPVYVVKFLRPGFAFYTNVYGKEILLGTDFNELIQQSQRSYFLIRQSEYDRLTVANRQSIIILSSIGDKVLLLKE
ncbi:ArnT family glycosyltransferase [Pelosinus propionicus]|uniref:4-amino-4-deoxy-L-arabinose transferase n=1 Tax=Pelosinus propionicus DSM 13327 TaxID=1123291 RepID=A0A1I4H865_9FIRM|nr:glycosyltransferase family 39 protein [Pelosinus propionicus]SFL38479.1 4-amino-4-deoxy-L-arabinose transferase [Pelosinus propionicus DSM 13327]